MCRRCIGEGVALVLSEPAVDAWLGIPEELVVIVKSFHESMKARIRVDGEEIEVENELRQGCTMAPSLFNLYACLVAERWLDGVTGVEGVGTYLLYKYETEIPGGQAAIHCMSVNLQITWRVAVWARAKDILS